MKIFIAILSSTFISLLLCRLVQAAEEPPVIHLAQSLMERGFSAYQLGKQSKDDAERQRYFEVVIKNFERLLRDYPDFHKVQEVQYFLGQSFFEIGNSAKGNQVFQAIVKDSKAGDYLVVAASKLANDAFRKKEYKNAAALYANMMANATTATDRIRGAYMQARCAQLLENDSDAMRWYEVVLADADAPASEFFLASLRAAALLRMQSSSFDKAQDYFLKLSGAAKKESERVEALLFCGISALRAKNEQRAEESFLQVIQNKNEDALAFHSDAINQLLILYYQRKEYQRVIDLHGKHGVSRPVSIQQLLLVARSMMSLEKFSNAIALFSQIEKQGENDSLTAEAAYLSLLCHQKIDSSDIARKVDDYLQTYQKKEKNQHRIQTAYLLKAVAFQQRSMQKEAASVYRMIDPSMLDESYRANCYLQKGICLAAVNLEKEAINALSTLIQEYPADQRVPEALALRGDCYSKTNQSDLALADFSKLLASKPEARIAIYAWQKSASIKKERSDFAGMIQCYESLLSAVPQLPTETKAEAFFYSGFGYVKISKHKNAILPLSEARKLVPASYDKDASLLLMNCHYQLEDKNALFAEIDRSIEKNFVHAVAPAMIEWAASQALQLTRADLANRFLSQIVNEQSPEKTSKAIWRNLAIARMRTKNYEGSIFANRQFLQQETRNAFRASALCDEAKCYLKLDQTKDAKAAIDQVFQMKPGDDLKKEAELILGDCYIAMNDLDNAQQILASNAILTFDRVYKPQFLYKLIQVLDAKNDTQQANKHREELKNEFPGWVPEP